MPADDRGGRRQGTLVDWKDDRGFGFISPAAGGSRVFVHVSAFPGGRRPADGSEVTYVEVRDENDRARAAEVQYRGAAPTRLSVTGTAEAVTVATLFFLLLLGLAALDELPLLVVAAYGLLSAVAFLVYAADKSAARQGRWRTAESTLHLVGLVGGWPGALVARRVLRHKTVKQPFRTIFWVTVVANCAALAWFVAGGSDTLL
ncbi:cold shock and DUF1294 domain-containing protein [Nocardioides sp. S-58]|uniref:Cold shock and DUF1294 domain-containing protein n=1 Tax=Nocardioides renjunii TaxID=3095075 RepID=A0ABU5KG08_9ACTN|nr:cold shock and DUF1294 domain-containing protein [Nocardioides sp. S-58]MDZ5663384.1 cold shock and DUF1294 domain-containing protein [Nocardioides sp. S-58]